MTVIPRLVKQKIPEGQFAYVEMPLRITSSKTYHYAVGVRTVKSVICGKCLLLVFHHSQLSVVVIMVEFAL